MADTTGKKNRNALWCIGVGRPYRGSCPGAAAARHALRCRREVVRAVATTYQKETGVQVDTTRMSAGEVYARVRAEKDNPHGDVWFGGTGDPHLQAADGKITEPYESPMLPKLRDWAQRQAERAHNRTVGLYLGALGFGYNTEEIKRRKLAPPACWADLIKPEFKGEVQMADPNSSGTAWTMLATIVQLMGEEKGFEYLKARCTKTSTNTLRQARRRRSRQAGVRRSSASRSSTT
jgi:ABC-type Fe3+ transport system substrate-binding protein